MKFLFSFFCIIILNASGGLAVGIPGEVAGLWVAHQNFGKVAWADLVKFSQDLALNGFRVSKLLADSLEQHKEKLQADPILRYSSLFGLQDKKNLVVIFLFFSTCFTI